MRKAGRQEKFSFLPSCLPYLNLGRAAQLGDAGVQFNLRRSCQRASSHLRLSSRNRFRCDDGGFVNAFAASVIQIDELFCLGDVTDDVEPADGFLFRRFKGDSGVAEIFAFGDIFCPLAIAGEIFE
jgi:hypothetical protein